MVPVGVIGLSPAWETRYRPALKSLRNRIVVRAVYDSVLSRAEQAAAELGAIPVAGMQALARRDDLKALLVFDTGWCGPGAIRLLCRAGRPIFIGGSFAADEATLDRLADAAVGCGTMVMPALDSRYTPSTFRLRELMATRLGRPLQIEIDAECPARSTNGHSTAEGPWEDFVARLADWCCYVVPTPPAGVQAAATDSGAPETIQLTFARPRIGGEFPLADIRLRSTSSFAAADVVVPRYRVRCERGEATLDAVDRITWRTDSEQGDESLAADRSAVQVMLDHFCRRVVGGLIPVADLDDVRRSHALVRAVAQSHRIGSPVRLNGQA
ncbi:MAG: hypothetical protein WBC44_17100 [Planctomycetaceae bacterium]